MIIIFGKRRRRRRISITAGLAAEGSEACGSKDDGKIVLEEGEHMEYWHSLLVFALFEDVMLSCCETAGSVRFALFTSGYGYSPSSIIFAVEKKEGKNLSFRKPLLILQREDNGI